MILCKVLGNVTATIKHPCYIGKKVMMVQPVSLKDLSPDGASFLAVDTVEAGPGEIVWVNKEGGSSLIAVREERIPVHSTITGIVDTINIKRQ